jgi:hypothetical protein
MTLHKVTACIVGAFALGFLVSELASVPHAHAQSGFQIYFQSVVGEPTNKPINLQGSRVVGFSCDRGTCYVATQ